MSEASRLEAHVQQLISIADLLLAAAHADGSVSWSERAAIAKVMADFVGAGQLPEVVRDHIQSFEPAGFDIREAVSHLTTTSPPR